MVSITLEGLWIVSDRIVDFQFFVKFYLSGPKIIFSFWTITEHVSYGSKNLLIKPRFIRASSRWWVLLWKDYGCFLIELTILKFSSNFTGPDLQYNFWTIMEYVSYASKKLLIKPRFIWTSSSWSVLLWKDYGCFLIELSTLNFLSNFTGPDLQ